MFTTYESISFSEKMVSRLKDEVAKLLSQIEKQEKTISNLRKQYEDVQNDCEAWKKNYTAVHNKLLQVEYEKSDAAKIDLQIENTRLNGEISKLQREFTLFLDEAYDEKQINKTRFENSL